VPWLEPDSRRTRAPTKCSGDSARTFSTDVLHQRRSSVSPSWAHATTSVHALERIGRASTGPEISEDWLVAHEAFHLAILTGCGNSYLYGAASRLRSISEVYRCWSSPESHRTYRDVEAEHRAIMEAAIGRDADLAASASGTSRLTTELLIASQPAPTPA